MRIVVLPVAVRIAALRRRGVVVAEIGGRLRGNADIEIHHGAVRRGRSADDSVRIVTRGAGYIGMIVSMRADTAHGRQVMALAAKCAARRAEPASATSAHRILIEIELQ